jgi:hypothetical protein
MPPGARCLHPLWRGCMLQAECALATHNTVAARMLCSSDEVMAPEQTTDHTIQALCACAMGRTGDEAKGAGLQQGMLRRRCGRQVREGQGRPGSDALQGRQGRRLPVRQPPAA